MAITNVTFAKLEKRGWSKCSGYDRGWYHFVDASIPTHKQTIFQNNSYWFKDSTLLTISMRYFAGVTKDGRRLQDPDNTQQHVVVIETSYPGVKEKLGLTCPEVSRAH